MKNIEQEELDELKEELIQRCYDMLSKDEIFTFEKMLYQFPDITQDEMAGGLSMIYMGYPKAKNYDGTADYIIREHGTLFDGWIPDRVEIWLSEYISENNPVSTIKFN